MQYSNSYFSCLRQPSAFFIISPMKMKFGPWRDTWNGLTTWIKQKWALREATFQSGSHAWWACVPGSIFRKTWQMAGKEGTDSPNWMTWCEKEVFPFYPHFLFRNWPVSAIAWLGLTTWHVGCWWGNNYFSGLDVRGEKPQ